MNGIDSIPATPHGGRGIPMRTGHPLQPDANAVRAAL